MILAEYKTALQVLELHRNPIFQSKIQQPPLRQTSVTSGQNPAALDKSLKQGTKTIQQKSKDKAGSDIGSV